MSRVAVLIPCYNEAVALPRVLAAFRAALPEASLHACDNNSTDGTAEVARAAGAAVCAERRQGKGNAVRRLFAEVEADVYLLVDGDDTYDASAAPAMIALLERDGLDMVTGVRVSEAQAAYRRGHRAGNVALTGLVARLFGAEIGDMLSGYRAFSRRFVKSFPAMTGGFETETELTVHALELAMPTGEVAVRYRERPEGSQSKLRTYRDGWRILRLILLLVRDERPLPFFSMVAVLLVVGGLGLGLPVVVEYLRTGLVPRLPTAIVAAAMIALASLSLACGLILDGVARGRREFKRLTYLGIPGPGSAARNREVPALPGTSAPAP